MFVRKIVTVREFIGELGISRQTFYDWKKNGWVRTLKRGMGRGHTFVPASEIKRIKKRINSTREELSDGGSTKPTR
mgnify:CR=1 FL=1